MILFWAIGALFAAGVLAALLWPLLRRAGADPVSRRAANLAIYRDQLRELDTDLAAGTLARADYERARAELEARALEDVEGQAEPAAARSSGTRMAALVLGIATPLVALGVYFAVGMPQALAPQTAQAPHGAAGSDVTAEQIEQMVVRLAARMRENPDDADGWKLLGRSYAVLGRFPEAVEAYAQAAQRAPRDAQLLADFADVLAMVRGRSLQGEPENLVRKALEIEPQNLKALALAGTAAFERRDYGKAAEYWERMLSLVPSGSEDARIIRANVDEARSLAGNPPLASAAPAAAPHPGLKGTVRLAPALKARAQPGDTVFIYARPAKGPPMPLAVLRRKAGELPIEYALDDSMAMAPGMSLSSQDFVVITARVSRSGNAQPQPGDLQGASAPVPSDASGVDVVIDTVVR